MVTIKVILFICNTLSEIVQKLDMEYITATTSKKICRKESL
jgi:hypothetical protein